jgi:hypothetical protein
MKLQIQFVLILIGILFVFVGVLLNVRDSGRFDGILQSMQGGTTAERSPDTGAKSTAPLFPTLTPIVVEQSYGTSFSVREMFFSTNCNVANPEVAVFVETSGVANYSQDDGGVTTTYYPQHMLDCRRDTAWRTPYRGIEEWIRFTFSKPIRLDRVGLVAGYDKFDPYTNRDRWYQNRRITAVKFTIFLSDGSVCEQYWDPNPDDRSMQYFDTSSCMQNSTTASVVLSIRASQPPMTNDPRDFVVISDVDFQGMSYE